MATRDISKPKKKANRQGAAILFEDEVTFRQEPTLHQTWARRGDQPQIPSTGQRKTKKIFGTINLYTGRFLYQYQPRFTADTYIVYLERILKLYFPQKIFFIQDNAPYHKGKVFQWEEDNKKHISIYRLPPYCPDLNPIERIWHYVRMRATHNRYFPSINDLHYTLNSTFRSIQKNPSQILGFLYPFF